MNFILCFCVIYLKQNLVSICWNESTNWNIRSEIRDNISRDFPQESEVVAALIRDFNYLYKVSVYQIKFDGSQASCPIGTTPVANSSYHYKLGL
jgi:hypothetical protein